MQKILSQGNNCPQKNSTECECYDGVQTVIGIAENHLVEVNFTTEHLMEYIFSPGNLNNAYLQVKRNAGASGVDKMEIAELLPYLRQHKEELVKSLIQGTYRPNPVRRVRMFIWKCWKKVKTKFRNLIKCKIDRNQAWQWANTRKSYWRTSKSPILNIALNSDNLRKAGYPFLSDYYCKVYRN